MAGDPFCINGKHFRTAYTASFTSLSPESSDSKTLSSPGPHPKVVGDDIAKLGEGVDIHFLKFQGNMTITAPQHLSCQADRKIEPLLGPDEIQYDADGLPFCNHLTSTEQHAVKTQVFYLCPERLCCTGNKSLKTDRNTNEFSLFHNVTPKPPISIPFTLTTFILSASADDYATS